MDQDRALEILAIQKLQNYVENCNDMERAKIICRAFLKKYDSEPKPSHVPNSVTDVLGTDKHILRVSTIIDESYFSRQYEREAWHSDGKLDPSTESFFIEKGLYQLSNDIWNKGFVKTQHYIKQATFKRELQLSIGVFKL